VVTYDKQLDYVIVLTLICASYFILSLLILPRQSDGKGRVGFGPLTNSLCPSPGGFIVAVILVSHAALRWLALSKVTIRLQSYLQFEKVETVEHTDIGMPYRLVDSDFQLISPTRLAPYWDLCLKPVLKVHLHYTRMAQEIPEVVENNMHHEPSEKGNSSVSKSLGYSSSYNLYLDKAFF